MRKFKSVEDLFFAFGGSVHLAAFTNMNQWSVERWRFRGVPEKFWPTICAKMECAPENLKEISEKARRLRKK